METASPSELKQTQSISHLSHMISLEGSHPFREQLVGCWPLTQTTGFTAAEGEQFSICCHHCWVPETTGKLQRGWKAMDISEDRVCLCLTLQLEFLENIFQSRFISTWMTSSPCKASICLGLLCLSLLPWPSFPKSPSPQLNTSPVSVRAIECPSDPQDVTSWVTT